MKKLIVTFFALILMIGFSGASEKRVAKSEHGLLLNRLVSAYPDFLEGHDGSSLIWRDGTKMPFDDQRTGKTFQQLLNAPDLEDQFFVPYPVRDWKAPPAKNSDPGRVRFQPFFTKMYGDCRKGEVRSRLKPVVWLPKHDGRTIKVTSVNKIHEKLKAISVKLDALIDQKPEMKKYLTPMSGIYNCRVIAGTKRYSVHAYGAALDLNVKQAHYWRWTKPRKDGSLVWKNKIPMEIVRIFEQFGFIWGGKWYHYDSMHFEYRPELLVSP